MAVSVHGLDGVGGPSHAVVCEMLGAASPGGDFGGAGNAGSSASSGGVGLSPESGLLASGWERLPESLRAVVRELLSFRAFQISTGAAGTLPGFGPDKREMLVGLCDLLWADSGALLAAFDA